MKKSKINYLLRYYLYIFFVILFTCNSTFANLLKPSPLLEPNQVIAIQLSALNNNDFPYKNFGIKQTWEFAHPNNRKFTGPLVNFTKMMYSSSYVKMINHKKHRINLMNSSDLAAIFFVEIIDEDGAKFGFN